MGFLIFPRVVTLYPYLPLDYFGPSLLDLDRVRVLVLGDKFAVIDLG